MVEYDTGENRGYDCRKRSLEIKERDDYTCQRCGEEKYVDGEYNTAVVTHHIVPGRELPKRDARCDLNLVAVCARCHATIEEKPPEEQFAQCQRKVASLALDMLSDGRVTPSYVSDIADVPEVYVRGRLRELKRLGLVHDLHRGLYELNEED